MPLCLHVSQEGFMQNHRITVKYVLEWALYFSKWKLLSHVWLFVTPWTVVHGILQARILEWVAFPFSRESSQCRDRTQVSRVAGRLFTNWAIREAFSNRNNKMSKASLASRNPTPASASLPAYQWLHRLNFLLFKLSQSFHISVLWYNLFLPTRTSFHITFYQWVGPQTSRSKSSLRNHPWWQSPSLLEFPQHPGHFSVRGHGIVMTHLLVCLLHETEDIRKAEWMNEWSKSIKCLKSLTMLFVCQW